ncbi:MAG: UDP-N-acetylglucosamine--N-acetylmuramyl-(pentapeptide) pyrophosphoryl-undecaprenol N-acetylglucosamine transferase [candidate division WOR-3 bacterium]
MELLIATGGTGGHIYPAMALAEEARSRGIPVLFLLGQIKEGIIAEGISGIKVPSGPLSGVPVGRRLTSGIKIAFGTIKCLRLVGRGPIVAFGSYASVPILLAARIMRKRYWLMEQNVIPGATVRAFARGAAAVFTTFPETEAHLSGARCFVSGNPLRGNLREIPKPEARASLGFDERPLVLVMGGSQGARALTAIALEIATSVPDLQFLVIAGKRDYPMFRRDYPERGENFLLVDYLPNVSPAYSAADIAIARAGGGISQELGFFGLPAILVPFPHAADDHQRANAEALAKTGGVVVLSEDRLEELPRLLCDLLRNSQRLSFMAQAIRGFAKPRAAAVVLEVVLKETKKEVLE